MGRLRSLCVGSVAEPMCRVGGWLHLHNHATSWPNLQMRICKNSSQVEFQVGPSVAINFLGGGLSNLPSLIDTI